MISACTNIILLCIDNYFRLIIIRIFDWIEDKVNSMVVACTNIILLCIDNYFRLIIIRIFVSEFHGCGYDNISIIIIEQVELGNPTKLAQGEVYWQNQLRCFVENGKKGHCYKKEMWSSMFGDVMTNYATVIYFFLVGKHDSCMLYVNVWP